MKSPPDIALRLKELVQRRNREIAFDAGLKALLGIAFSAITFGVLFWMSWLAGIFAAPCTELYGWQFGAIVTGLFFVAATWSAWRHVDPLAGLEPMTGQQILLTLVSQAAGGLGYFSPRHAVAGAAIVLLGGPAGVFQALGIWAHRIRADAGLLDKAARLLYLCQAELPAAEVRAPAAAFLLRRLTLIKIVPCGESVALLLTDSGFALLAGKGKRASAKGISKAKRAEDA